MTLDSIIQSVLDREAKQDEAAWPPPLDGLRAAGEVELRRRRARRRFATALAAGVLIALPTGIFLTDPNGSDGPSADRRPASTAPTVRLDELPVGAPPTSLYCLDGVAHWRGDELRLRDGTCDWPNRFAAAADSAIVADAAQSTLILFTDRGREQLPGRVDNEASPVVYSPDGRLVAWVTRSRVDGVEEVVLWDPARGVEVDRAPAPTPDLLNLEGIDASGRVYLTSVGEGSSGPADRIWVWASRQFEQFRQVVGLGDFLTVAEVPPDGLGVLQTTGSAVWGTVTDRGVFVHGVTTAVQPVVWSPDRSRYVAVDPLTVVSVAGGAADVRLRLPSDVIVADTPSWESSNQVLVPVEPIQAGGLMILRCSAETGRCQRAAAGQRSVALPGRDSHTMG